MLRRGSFKPSDDTLLLITGKNEKLDIISRFFGDFELDAPSLITIELLILFCELPRSRTNILASWSQL
jgi:hypothetical protein